MAVPSEALVLLLILVLGMVGRNALIVVASVILLVLRPLPFSQVLTFLERRGIAIGLTFLTLAVLAPLAGGQLHSGELLSSFKRPSGILAIVGGVIAAWICARGVTLLETDPAVIIGLIVGSIMGTAFFRGIPVGPLFAAGVAEVFLQVLSFWR